MNDVYVSQPPRQLGLALHLSALVLLVAAGAWGLWRASNASLGLPFLLHLIPALLALSLGPALAYRAYALLRAVYVLERDSLRLQWGLRVVVIPMEAVLWVRPANSLEGPLPLPPLRLPGSVLGMRSHPELGNIEFLASTTGSLVLIGTGERTFAISPEDADTFVKTFQSYIEMGSTTPVPAQSIYPSFLLARVWADVPARALLLAGLALSLVLLAWVSLEIPVRDQVILGFDPGGLPRDLVPAVRLLLLPVLNGMVFLADLLLGLYFYRRDEQRHVSYLLWGSGALTPLLFIVGVFFSLQASQ